MMDFALRLVIHIFFLPGLVGDDVSDGLARAKGTKMGYPCQQAPRLDVDHTAGVSRHL